MTQLLEFNVTVARKRACCHCRTLLRSLERAGRETAVLAVEECFFVFFYVLCWVKRTEQVGGRGNIDHNDNKKPVIHLIARLTLVPEMTLEIVKVCRRDFFV
ncbi:hypothetical protein TRVL_10039 [Trypanosoma vivax]|nr:hypothetical protein TRVL_10039 [Trypanosoma vivax]